MKCYLPCFIQMKEARRSTHAFLIRCMQWALGPLQRSLGRAEQLRVVIGGKMKNQTLFLGARLLPPGSPLPYLYILFREEGQAWFVHKLQFLGGPHTQLGFSSWIRLPGKPSWEPRKAGAPGLTAESQEAGCTEGRWTGQRREAGLLVTGGIQKMGYWRRPGLLSLLLLSFCE